MLRLDRARQHDVAAVHDVLAARGVLLLHGPPRHPQYYGKLERLNRDQREWLRNDPSAVDGEAIDRMMQSLNNRWPRRRLRWRTAGQEWNTRPTLNVDRVEMRKEVEEVCARLVAERGFTSDVGWRLAVEQALTKRGLLRVVPGGGC